MRPTVGFALCGSFCTFRKAIDALRALTAQYTVVPIFSDAAWETDTRFGASADFRAEVTALCGTEPLHTLAQVEPLGPKRLLDLLIVAHLYGQYARQACKRHRRLARQLCLQGASAQRPPRAAGRFHERRPVRQRRESGCAAGPPSFLLRPLRAGQPDRQARQPCGTFFPAAGGGRGRAAG